MAGSSTKVVVIAFLMNLGIAIAKFIGYFFSGSAAMLAEGVHSVADTSNQIFLYVGLKTSQKAASKTHPFGYGMEQYIWSFLVALLIFALGAIFSIYEGIHKLTSDPHPLESVHINIIILSIGILLEGYSSYVATKEAKKVRKGEPLFKFAKRSKDQVLVTVLFEDYAALLGLSLALMGTIGYVITQNPIFDSLATILIGLLLAVIAWFLYREARSLLVGEAASEEHQKAIAEAFNNHPKVVKLKELLTMHLSANQILVNAHVKFATNLCLEEIEEIIDEIEDEIVQKVPEVFKIFIETHQRESVIPLSDRRSTLQKSRKAPSPPTQNDIEPDEQAEEK